MHTLRTTVETLRRAAAHLRLVSAVAIEARDDGVSNLLNQELQIAIVRVLH